MSYQIRSSSGILELSSRSFVLLLTCFSSSAVHEHIFINSLNCTLYHLSHNFQFSSSSDASVDLHLFYPPTRRLFHPPTPANLKSLHIQICITAFCYLLNIQISTTQFVLSKPFQVLQKLYTNCTLLNIQISTTQFVLSKPFQVLPNLYIQIVPFIAMDLTELMRDIHRLTEDLNVWSSEFCIPIST